MTSDHASSARSQKPSWRLILGIPAFLVIVLITPLIVAALNYSRTSAAFLSRAKEVDRLISAIYLQYFETNAWPATLADLKDPKFSQLPADWQYSIVNEPDAGEQPVLRLRGPLHMKLEYAFRKDGNLQSAGGWRAKMEGDGVAHPFQEVIPPKPDARHREKAALAK